MAVAPQEVFVYVDADMATKALIDILEIVRHRPPAGIIERCNRLDQVARVASRALRQLKVRNHETAERRTTAMAGAAPAAPQLPGFE